MFNTDQLVFRPTLFHCIACKYSKKKDSFGRRLTICSACGCIMEIKTKLAAPCPVYRTENDFRKENESYRV